MLESSPLGVACLMSSGGGSRAAPTVLLDPVGNASCLSLYCYCSNILHYQLGFSEFGGLSARPMGSAWLWIWSQQVKTRTSQRLARTYISLPTKLNGTPNALQGCKARRAIRASP